MKKNILKELISTQNIYLDTKITTSGKLWDPEGVLGTFSSGNGTENDPFLIGKPEEFLSFLEYSEDNKFYKLKNNIFFNFHSSYKSDSNSFVSEDEKTLYVGETEGDYNFKNDFRGGHLDGNNFSIIGFAVKENISILRDVGDYSFSFKNISFLNTNASFVNDLETEESIFFENFHFFGTNSKFANSLKCDGSDFEIRNSNLNKKEISEITNPDENNFSIIDSKNINITSLDYAKNIEFSSNIFIGTITQSITANNSYFSNENGMTFSSGSNGTFRNCLFAKNNSGSGTLDLSNCFFENDDFSLENLKELNSQLEENDFSWIIKNGKMSLSGDKDSGLNFEYIYNDKFETIEENQGTEDFEGGDGTELDPFLIKNVKQFRSLLEITENKKKYFKLIDDLFFNNSENREDWIEHITLGNLTAMPFIFDGNNKTIYGFYGASLFESLPQDSIIKNLRVSEWKLPTNKTKFTLFANDFMGTIENCILEEIIIDGELENNSKINGFCSSRQYSQYITIKNCRNYASLKTNASVMVGGIASQFYLKNDSCKVTIENCKNYGNFSVGNDSTVAGIFLSKFEEDPNLETTIKIENSENHGNIECKENGEVFGITLKTSSIKNCKNFGSIYGENSSKCSGIAYSFCLGEDLENHGKIIGENVSGINNSFFSIINEDEEEKKASIIFAKNFSDIDGTKNAAGISLNIDNVDQINNCFNTGNITSGLELAAGLFCERKEDVTELNIENCGNYGNFKGINFPAAGCLGMTNGKTNILNFVNFCSEKDEYSSAVIGTANEDVYLENIFVSDNFQDHIFYSKGSEQFVLDIKTSTWKPKIWKDENNNVFLPFAVSIWSDGENIYNRDTHVFDFKDSVWKPKTFYGLENFYSFGNIFNAENVWNNKKDVFFSQEQNFVLNKETSTWIPKVWNANSSHWGREVWKDKENIYSSGGANNSQFILNFDESTEEWKWESKVWNWSGLNPPSSEDLVLGSLIWNDLERNSYFSFFFNGENYQYKLNKETSTWEEKEWLEEHPSSEPLIKSGRDIWNDENNILFSSSVLVSSFYYVLDKETSTWNRKTWNFESSNPPEYISRDFIWKFSKGLVFSTLGDVTKENVYIFDQTKILEGRVGTEYEDEQLVKSLNKIAYSLLEENLDILPWKETVEKEYKEEDITLPTPDLENSFLK